MKIGRSAFDHAFAEGGLGPSREPVEWAGALVGRTAERQALEALVNAARDGRGDSVVLHGAAGMGKSALIDGLRRHAQGFAIVGISAAPSERDLEYGALHQLCRPHIDGMERLSEPQRAALGTTLGLVAGSPTNPFFLGLAVHGLLSVAAAGRPLLCLVDDAQWLDEASASVLGFVGRRLDSVRVALVIASRTERPALAGLTHLRLSGLRHQESAEVLRRALHVPLDVRVAERLISEAGGNPGTLLRVAQGTEPAQFAGGFGDPDAGEVLQSEFTTISRRVAGLDKDARLLLLLAAAEPLGEPLLLWRAAEELGISPAAADTAEQAGLLDIGTRVRFEQPLARAAVYRAATPLERRTVHRALGRASDALADPERRAWHRARGTAVPDDEIAAEVERSAEYVAAQGGVGASAAFLRRAAALTAQPAERGRRALIAAEASWRAGDPEDALQVLVTAETAPLDELGRARAALVRARVAAGAGVPDGVRQLAATAKRLARLDSARSREAYLDAFASAIILGSLGGEDVARMAEEALAIPRSEPPRPTDLLLDGLAMRTTHGLVAAAPMLRRAVIAFRSDDAAPETVLEWGWLAAYVAAVLWDHEAHEALGQRVARLGREAGALATLPHALSNRITIHLRQGELNEAAVLLREAEAAASATGSQMPAPIALLAYGYGGRERDLPAIAAGRAGLPRTGLDAVIVQLAGTLLCNGLGRFGEALRFGREALDDPESVAAPPWVLPELVEAAVGAGSGADAAVALDRLSAHAAVCGSDWALGLEARSRALLSTGAAAEQHFQKAIRLLESPGSRTDLARARLLYGEWLRRAGRRADAREQLRRAHTDLDAMGLEAFATRARDELRASGETVRGRGDELELTPQERQIALLARQGLSNQQIGAQLYLSPRTVEWHLRKVFAKLGIASRNALRDALPEEAADSSESVLA